MDVLHCLRLYHVEVVDEFTTRVRDAGFREKGKVALKHSDSVDARWKRPSSAMREESPRLFDEMKFHK